ncbi:MAG: recombination protein O N-terminal domain-containing protein [Cardiobacteriaceae bacterium]|nr:recombination protein O N-terminal domain-containing protein [Cardiobacteriaceae bacterium]
MLIFEQEPSYILHRTPYQEHRYLLDLLTQHYGRIRAVANISRQKTHRHTEQFAPFRLLSIEGYQKQELATIKHAEVSTIYSPNPQESLNLYYLHELLIGLLPLNMAYEAVFTAYQSALHYPDAFSLRLMEYTLLQTLQLLPAPPTTASAFYTLQQSALGIQWETQTSGFANDVVMSLYHANPSHLFQHPQTKALYQALLFPHLKRPPTIKATAQSLKALFTAPQNHK